MEVAELLKRDASEVPELDKNTEYALHGNVCETSQINEIRRWLSKYTIRIKKEYLRSRRYCFVVYHHIHFDSYDIWVKQSWPRCVEKRNAFLVIICFNSS